MDFYLDTAQLDEIRAATEWGVVRCVTTNPSHMAKAGVRDMRSHFQEICWTADVPTSVEVVTTDAGEMVTQAQDYATWSPNVVVKLPTIPAGLKAMARVTKTPVTALCTGCAHFDGCPIPARFAAAGKLERTPEVNSTLIFTANQAMLALAAGASYVSPFVGRLDAVGEDGMLVAPVFSESRKPVARNLYLPAGEWFDFWTGERVTGGAYVTRVCELDTIPLYVRVGTILPLGPERPFIDDEIPDELTVDVYTGGEGMAQVVWDAGGNASTLHLQHSRGGWKLDVEGDRVVTWSVRWHTGTGIVEAESKRVASASFLYA